MLSLWPHAAHFAQLCTLPTDAGDLVAEEKAGTERAETRPAFPGLS